MLIVALIAIVILLSLLLNAVGAVDLGIGGMGRREVIVHER
jgi:hypothetical protein